MKVWLTSLLLIAYASVLSAQPVDLLQQLYGKTASDSKRSLPESTVVEAKPDPIAPLIFTLNERFEASRERLFVGDLLSCKGPKTICDEAKLIDIGVAPKPLRYERYSPAQINHLLDGELYGHVVLWEGSDYCMVSAVSSPVNEESVMKVIREEFEDSPAGMRVAIQSIRVPTLQILRHSNYSYRVQNFGDQVTRVFQNPRTKLAQIRIEAIDLDPASQSLIEFSVQVSLSIEIEALVLKEGKERGERLTQDSFDLRWIPFQDQIMSDPKQIEGKLLKTRVQAGMPIRSWNLAREPEVLRGDRIEAIMSSNGLRMNSVAQALEPGFIGQKIRIKLESTKKTIMGTVIARSKVEVTSL